MRLSSASLLFSLAASAGCGARSSSSYVAFAAAAATAAATNNSHASAFISASGSIHKSIGSNSALQQKLYSSSSSSSEMPVDPEYPGTAVERLLSVRDRVGNLTKDDLNGDWEAVRRKILWAGGLKDLPHSIPGQGYTGHSFNDYNHVDLTTMLDKVSHNENDGSINQIAVGNQLGPGIRIASIPDLGPGGSWSTCANGCNQDPPQDVAHIQFRSRIAFKLVWCPTERFDTFVLVDDDGKELARGNPTGDLPRLNQRQMNYRIVMGSKYATAADDIAKLLNAASTE
ncbi:MAG: hypothetical protein SGILL_009454 [Bacillariaceae sp.]